MEMRFLNRPAVSTHQPEDIAPRPSPACWLTASPSSGLTGDIEVPGDKSMSHRALIFGGMAKGQTRVTGMLEGQDVLHTADAVRSFGPRVERIGSGDWLIEGCEWHSPPTPINCGNSGTGVRLLMGAAAGFDLDVTFTGDESLSSRPMERVLMPLRRMGARTEGSMLPVTLRGGALQGIEFVNTRSSAQVKSAILLAGLRASGDVQVVEPLPSRDHTENMLRAFGCELEVENGSIRLGERRSLNGTSVRIPGDPSSAAFLIVAALLVRDSEILLRNVLINPLRTGLIEALKQMGADIQFENARSEAGEPIADLKVRASALHGIKVPASRAPSMIDEYPILAIAAAFAHGRTVMHGLGELRVKESDRLAAMVEGLRACGVEAHEHGDSLVVEGRGAWASREVEIDAHDDHRIAMSFLVLGLAARGPVRVNGAEMISTSFPGFAALMRSIGADIA